MVRVDAALQVQRIVRSQQLQQQRQLTSVTGGCTAIRNYDALVQHSDKPIT